MERMTIKEVADHFNVSKNTVKYRMKKLSADQITREGDLIYILEAGITELAKGFNKPVENRQEPAENQKEPSELVELLKSQLLVKDHQIEELTKKLTEADESDNEMITLLSEQIEKKDRQIEHLTEMLRIEQMKSANLLRIEADQKPRGLLSFFKRKKVSGDT